MDNCSGPLWKVWLPAVWIGLRALQFLEVDASVLLPSLVWEFAIEFGAVLFRDIKKLFKTNWVLKFSLRWRLLHSTLGHLCRGRFGWSSLGLPWGCSVLAPFSWIQVLRFVLIKVLPITVTYCIKLNSGVAYSYCYYAPVQVFKCR